MAMHALPTTRNYFLELFFTLSVHSPAFFPKPPPSFPVLAVANTGSCVGLQNKISQPAPRAG